MLKLLTPKTTQTVNMKPKEMVTRLQEYFDVNIASIDSGIEIKSDQNLWYGKIIDRCQKNNGTKFFPYKKVKLGTVKQEIEKLLKQPFDLTTIPNPKTDKQRLAEYLHNRFNKMQFTVNFSRISNKPKHLVVFQIPKDMRNAPDHSTVTFELKWKIRA